MKILENPIYYTIETLIGRLLQHAWVHYLERHVPRVRKISVVVSVARPDRPLSHWHGELQCCQVPDAAAAFLINLDPSRAQTVPAPALPARAGRFSASPAICCKWAAAAAAAVTGRRALGPLDHHGVSESVRGPGGRQPPAGRAMIIIDSEPESLALARF